MNTHPDSTVNVLIVDDDEQFAQLVAEFLGAEGGFSVAMRHDGAAGVEAAVNGQFDALFGISRFGRPGGGHQYEARKEHGWFELAGAIVRLPRHYRAKRCSDAAFCVSSGGGSGGNLQVLGE